MFNITQRGVKHIISQLYNLRGVSTS